MFTTKKDVDNHVRTAFSKLKSENEKKVRGFSIAKLYYKINEYEVARHYISYYLSVKEDCALGHKLLGQCYQQLKKPQKALESFQRSLQLDSKQPDILIEVCKLLLTDNSINVNKAKYWCDLAESEKIQHDAVFSLRLKLLSQDNMENKQVEDLILKEIASRPNDPNLKARLIKHFIEQNKILDAFKYAYDQELKHHDLFGNCAGWYNVVWLALSKYKHQSNTNKSWEFWLLLIICLERQVEISFSILESNPTETANLLFNLDQCIFEASQYIQSLSREKEFTERFLRHFRGQLCLHAASLIFKREQIQNKNQWKESTKNALPLLLLAFQCGAPDIHEPWLKHSDDKTKQLIQLWNREGAFRCSQAGRTLLSCIEDTKDCSVSSQVHQIITEKKCWANSDELISQVRGFCSDTSWRSKVFRILFANSDQIRKMSTSFLINNQNLIEPCYELPSYADVESYEEIAQYLKPQSLNHMVYLCLGLENLSDVKCKFFSGLNFSTQNLSFCGSESLNQLDIETFLYAATIQSKRLLEVTRIHNENYNSINVGKPKILPFVIMSENLSTEEQSNWWNCAYQVYRNLTGGENLGEIRATLIYGIEAVRGVNGPKMDVMIALKLGKIFANRSQDATKLAEKKYLEIRTETLYKHALNVYKLHNKGILEPFRKLFTYSNSNSSSAENEITELAEEAVTYLAELYFKNGEYEECIEKFSGMQLPFATYFQAEAYKKLDESNKTPKKTKKLYLDKARDCLNQTVNLLNYPNINSNHPLNSIVHSEIKRLQFIHQISNNESVNNGYLSDNREFHQTIDENSSFYVNRTRRESSSGPKLLELENLVKQMVTTLSFLKDEFVDIKPELIGIKTELNELRDKLNGIEEGMKKKSQTPSRDDASNVLDDLYIIGDELQNQVYANQSNLYTGFGVQPQLPPQQPTQRIHTPSALPNMVTNHGIVTPASTHHPQPANPWYTDYFTPPQYLTQMTPTASFSGQDRQHLSFNQRMTFVDTTNTPLNFNMPPPIPTPHQPQVSLQQPDNRPNLFGFMPQPAVSQLPTKNTTQPSQVVKNSPAFWNRIYNNAPVEKGPPVNVVITSSDPLPVQTNAGVFPQPTLSVTIPPQHIKPNFVPNDNISGGSTQMYSNTSFPIITQSFPTMSLPMTITNPISSASTTDNTYTTVTKPTPSIFGSTTLVNEINSNLSIPTVKFPTESPSLVLNKSFESNDENDQSNKSTENAEYDPRPDFKPLIPLPAEVEVKTGEEDEDVLFCSRAKLFRYVDKEWKERGIGDIKILKNKKDNKIRILMRRDQTHKICANHFITSEMNLIQAKNEEKSYIWAAKDFADEEEKSEKLCVRFKQVDTAKKFHDAFTKAKDEIKNISPEKPSSIANKNTVDKQTKETDNSDKNVTTNPLAKSITFNFNTMAQKNVGINTTTVTTAGLSFASKSAFPLINENQRKEDNPEEKDKSKNTSKSSSPFAGFTFDNKNALGNPNIISNNAFSNLLSSFAPKPPQLQTDKNEPVAITSNFFSTIPQNATSVLTVTNNNETLNKSNPKTEDDDFVPTAEFKPVIPLPDLVEVQTGEENENVLFEHRAKLFRYDKNTNQWKERGIGNIKLLSEKNNPNCVRLLMRREQVLKVCINLRLNKNIVFKSPPNSETSLQFGGKDYSEENDGKLELFTIRFKTAEICKNFHEVILKTQSNMTDEDTEKDIEVNKMSSTEPLEQLNKTDTNDKKSEPQGFGDRFKPKPGTWNCQDCCVSNKPEDLYCVACEAPKDDTIPKKPPKNFFDAKPKQTFSFGFPSVNTNETSKSGLTKTSVQALTPAAVGTTGFGDEFKPKVGSWSCTSCYVTNDESVLYCVACNMPKDETVPKKDTTQQKNIFDLSNPTSSFTFGFSNNVTTAPAIAATDATTRVPNPFEATGAVDLTYKFDGSFGTAKEDGGGDTGNKTKSNIFCFDPKSTNIAQTNPTTPSNVVAIATITTTTTTIVPPFNAFSFPKSSTIFGGLTANPADKSATTQSKSGFTFNLLNNNNNSGTGEQSSNDVNDFKLEKKEFTFALKPKSPGKVKSPLKSTSGAEEESDTENVEEENNTYFAPAIPLPAKIQVKTGEEDEEVLYSHRAKLYKFTDSEWKERGIGDVKILRHTENKKLRVVMRREQVLKICLNHVLTEDVEYMRKDDKSWHFVVRDFSEGELELTQFCLRFKTKEISEEFMNAVKASLLGIPTEKQQVNDNEVKSEEISEKSDKNITNSNEDGDVKKNQKLAEKLQLPIDFFDKKDHEDCKGCRGCDPEKFVFPDYQNIEEEPLPLDMLLLTFNKKITSSGGNSILKQSSLSFAKQNDNSTSVEPSESTTTTTTNVEKKSFISDENNLFGGRKSTNVFSLGDNINLFGSASSFNVTGEKSIFGGNSMPKIEFGKTAVSSISEPLFGSVNVSKPTQIDGNDNGGITSQHKSVFEGFSFNNQKTATDTAQFSFGNNENLTTFSNIAKIHQSIPPTEKSVNDGENREENVFKDPGISFSDLAAKVPSTTTDKQQNPPPVGGFFGLTQNDAFQHFMTPKSLKNNNTNEQNISVNSNNDEKNNSDVNYDPHYDPVIELPDKIEVITGEEDEEKLFGERSTLFRYDTETKQWKERGVGELKILYHPTQGTYRLLLRREQIYKLVLNHSITDDFSMKPMNNTGKAFCWAAQNYAEEPGWEKLACRFKNAEIGEKFEKVVNKCIEQLKKHADLEPEED